MVFKTMLHAGQVQVYRPSSSVVMPALVSLTSYAGFKRRLPLRMTRSRLPDVHGPFLKGPSAAVAVVCVAVCCTSAAGGSSSCSLCMGRFRRVRTTSAQGSAAAVPALVRLVTAFGESDGVFAPPRLGVGSVCRDLVVGVFAVCRDCSGVAADFLVPLVVAVWRDLALGVLAVCRDLADGAVRRVPLVVAVRRDLVEGLGAPPMVRRDHRRDQVWMASVRAHWSRLTSLPSAHTLMSR